MSVVEKRLIDLGLELPQVPTPVACFKNAVRTGNLIFISGQGTNINGEWRYQGRVGEKYSLEDGYKAAQCAILNCLAVLKSTIGDLDKVQKIVKILGWVNCTSDFNKQPYVMNGASELLEKIYGEHGKHARSAVSAHTLPFDTTVEIEMVAEVDSF